MDLDLRSDILNDKEYLADSYCMFETIFSLSGRAPAFYFKRKIIEVIYLLLGHGLACSLFLISF